MSRKTFINSIRTKRNEYLDDMAKVLGHMKRFRSAVEKARIEWGIPGGLPYENRVAWYRSFFIKPDIDVDNTKYANSQSELLPPSKMIRATLQKFSDEFNLDVRWHNSLFDHIAGNDVPLRAPSGLPYVEIRLNDSRLPKEEWIVKRMWIEIYADTSQKDFEAVWEQVKQPTIDYCLYARKSSEDDERQAMSIDSQIKEMSEMAVKEGLFIKEIRRESHSAKMSGQRPVFMKLIEDIQAGLFTGILTWAPDRLSRNAGDLGQLVDLMDQERLIHIKTFSQAFSNTPSEKFLLMILCSQAKLENDQKGINVKRGIRAKCQMGWRPGPPPIGYFNRAFNGIKDIIVDPERASFVTEMFKRVANNADSGRKIKRWLDKEGMTTRAGKGVTLSQIYMMLKNPFYYGRFEYPLGSGNWYEGKHKPLITKEIFEFVQKKLVSFPKSPWGGKIIAFKGLFKCGSCGSNIIGEEKWRKRKWGNPVKHIYYHCARQLNRCPEPYISEEKLIKQILRYINFMNIAHPNFLRLTESLQTSAKAYESVREEVLYDQEINPKNTPLDQVNFARYILYNGALQEKRDLVIAIGKQMYIRNNNYLQSSPEELNQAQK